MALVVVEPNQPIWQMFPGGSNGAELVRIEKKKIIIRLVLCPFAQLFAIFFI